MRRSRSEEGFLPTTAGEVASRGWDQVDVVFVTGDAYVDHPSFAMAILGRVLEAEGFRVAILPQPDWRSVDPFRSLGRPRLFFAVSAGNMDSMLNHYTAMKKPRSDDAYSEGGRPGMRPDRATNVYAQRCREAFSGVPVIAGGVEASLRRLAHYDYWSDTVRPSILVSSKADLVVYGMGEHAIREIARRLASGGSVAKLRDLRGVAYMLGAREEVPELADSLCGPGTPEDHTVEIPSFDDVRSSAREFALASRRTHLESNPLNARRLLQRHGERVVVQNPPSLPLSQAEMDAIYELPYRRAPHPRYREPIPAMEMMRTSVTIMRGCFGGCTFCSITTHQGRIIQSRSKESVAREVKTLSESDGFTGVVSDVGGPTANMYRMRCTKPDVEARCRRLSCVHPTVCKLLGTDHGPLIELLREARSQPGVRKVHVASGVRMDLAQKSPEYLRELAKHHVGGHLKVAPEHVAPEVLDRMKKPRKEDFERFSRAFARASREAGKKQYLVPYFIASHPGSTLESMIELAVFLKKNGFRPRQVQDFIPAPMDLATTMYHTGLDPMTLEEVPSARALRDRKAQRALLQFFLPQNWFLVRDALIAAGRRDLIGTSPDCLIGPRPPREAIEARRSAAPREFGEFVHRMADAGGGSARSPEGASRTSDRPGYRPGRAGFRKRRGRK